MSLICIVALSGGAVGCRAREPKVDVQEGTQFLHRIRIPTYKMPKGKIFFIRHYHFRMLPSSPDLLLAVGCGPIYPTPDIRFTGDRELCGTNPVAIDASRSYAVREASAAEWEQGQPIDEAKEISGGAEKPQKFPEPRPTPLVPDYTRYRYRDHIYRTRGDWETHLTTATSADGNLLVIAGADGRTIQGHMSLNLIVPNYTGTVIYDIYRTDTAHHVAAVVLDDGVDIYDQLTQSTLVNSRWLMVPLDLLMENVLLFDFQPTTKVIQ